MADSKLNQINQATTNLPDSDELLTKIIEENDHKGFELLHELLYNVLCNYACRFVYSKEAARDVVSEVFFRFWKNRKELKIKTSCRAYFFTAVKNQSFNYLTRQAKHMIPSEAYELDVLIHEGTPEEVYLYNELSDKIECAINTLSPQCKTVFTLSRYEGLKNVEIAQQLRLSLKNVEAHMTRALKSLRYSLKNELPYLILIISFFL
jgi:RNA polymerase sigma-70 factor (family 1)